LRWHSTRNLNDTLAARLLKRRRVLEALVRYMMRSPVSLSRLRFAPGSPEVVYLHKGGHDEIEPTEGERVDAM